VLEIYNQIAAAKQARRAYQTRLKPAPADPKLLPCLCIAVSHGPAGPAKSRVMNAMTDPARTFAVASDEVLVGLIARARNRVVVIAPALTQALADALSRRFNDLGRLDITVNEHTSENGYRLECGVEGGWLRYASTTARGSIWIAGASGRGPWLVSLDHSGVIAEIGPLPHSPTPGPGLAQEAGATEAKLFEEFTQADFESPAPLIRRSFVSQYAS
jgi:hypothetical protein